VGGVDLLLLLLLVGAVLGSAVLAMASTVLREFSRARARSLVAEGRRGAVSLVDVVERRGRALAVVHLLWWSTLVGAGGVAAVLGDRVAGAALAITLLLVSVAVLYVFGTVVPATLAERSLEGVALRLAGPVRGLVRFPPFAVLARLLGVVAGLVLGGRGLRGGSFGDAEEDAGATGAGAAAEAAIEQEEERLIHSVAEFGDTVVHEAMVPRPDMEAIRVGLSVDEALGAVLETGYSRLPVYDGTLDSIEGLVNLKDLVAAAHHGRGAEPLRDILRPAFFVPEQKRVAELLSEMRTRKQHMAIAVDEHGGIAGLITLEDILEELVGEIADEYDDEEALLEELPDGSWSIAGRAPIGEVNERLDLDLPDDEWDTVGGFVLHLAGEVPHVGDVEGYENLRFHVDRMQGRRIVRVIMRRIAPAEERVAAP
jgi:CBS domain containing-hemolysin-like protein